MGQVRGGGMWGREEGGHMGKGGRGGMQGSTLGLLFKRLHRVVAVAVLSG